MSDHPRRLQQTTSANTTSEDANQFVLLVDLWNAEGTQEVSLVRHSNSSPAISISAATTAPYPPPAERPYLGLLGPGELHNYFMSTGDHVAAANLQQFLPNQQNVAMYRNPITGQTGYPQGQPGQVQHPAYGANQTVPIPIMPIPSNGLFTKNLIGSLCANATRLNDTNNKPGYWFILQDLSVRTEGHFRYVFGASSHSRFITLVSLPLLKNGSSPDLESIAISSWQSFSGCPKFIAIGVIRSFIF